MKAHSLGLFALLMFALVFAPAVARADTSTLKVYLLTGQSNMVGHGYTTYASGGNQYNIPSLEFLVDSTPAALTIGAARLRLPSRPILDRLR